MNGNYSHVLIGARDFSDRHRNTRLHLQLHPSSDRVNDHFAIEPRLANGGVNLGSFTSR